LEDKIIEEHKQVQSNLPLIMNIENKKDSSNDKTKHRIPKSSDTNKPKTRKELREERLK